MTSKFKNRSEAGRVLADSLYEYKGRDGLIVLGLPRGGVPVAAEIARVLQAPLDVFLVRKLGTPGQEELAVGAIASGGVRIINTPVVNYFAIPAHVIEFIVENEQKELKRREQAYRDGRPPLQVEGRTIILVDDGLATGSSMRAAITALKTQNPAELIIGVPVAPPITCMELASEVQRLVCPVRPEPFDGVGRWYEDFSQTSDEEVQALLRKADTASQTQATEHA